MMILYVGYNLLDKKRQVMWKIKRGKQQFNKYVITLPFLMIMMYLTSIHLMYLLRNGIRIQIL